MAGLLLPWALGLVLTVALRDVRWLWLWPPFALLLHLAARRAPRGYLLAPDGLRVERRAGDLVVPYRSIRGVDRQRRPTLGLGLGSSGFLGWFTLGRAVRPGLGPYRLALTNRRDVVWLRTDAGWVAVSPERPDEFVERLRGRLPAAR
ncbi:MAG TPA: PH domain-containing protein [Methylomirabilota bacterium]|nr:PH domain-containing protein [Methylomirabilota bacterium]